MTVEGVTVVADTDVEVTVMEVVVKKVTSMVDVMLVLKDRATYTVLDSSVSTMEGREERGWTYDTAGVTVVRR